MRQLRARCVRANLGERCGEHRIEALFRESHGRGRCAQQALLCCDQLSLEAVEIGLIHALLRKATKIGARAFEHVARVGERLFEAGFVIPDRHEVLLGGPSPIDPSSDSVAKKMHAAGKLRA